MEQQKQAMSVAGAYLALLADRGVDYLFGNAGRFYTDRGRAGRADRGRRAAPHAGDTRNLGRGRTATVCCRGGSPSCGACQRRHRQYDLRGDERVARERLDLLTAGRSPLTEQGLPARGSSIHWAQEM